MKRTITGIIMLVGLFAVTAVVTNAQITRQIRTNVPFAFNVGKAELPAGEYVITYGITSNSGNTIVVRSADGRRGVVALVRSENPVLPSELTSVSFQRVNGRYYLGEISMYALKIDLGAPDSGIPGLKIAAK